MSVPLEAVNRNCNPAEAEIPDATCSRDAPVPPEGAPGVARATRARDYTAQIIAFPGLARQRFGKPVAREADGPQPARFRSPWTDDHPSPRCVLRDYCEGARHYCAGTPVLYIPYWLIAGLPLAVNMLASALHVMSVRPPLFYAFIIVGVLITVLR